MADGAVFCLGLIQLTVPPADILDDRVAAGHHASDVQVWTTPVCAGGSTMPPPGPRTRWIHVGPEVMGSIRPRIRGGLTSSSETVCIGLRHPAEPHRIGSNGRTTPCNIPVITFSDYHGDTRGSHPPGVIPNTPTAAGLHLLRPAPTGSQSVPKLDDPAPPTQPTSPRTPLCVASARLALGPEPGRRYIGTAAQNSKGCELHLALRRNHVDLRSVIRFGPKTNKTHTHTQTTNPKPPKHSGPS